MKIQILGIKGDLHKIEPADRINCVIQKYEDIGVYVQAYNPWNFIKFYDCKFVVTHGTDKMNVIVRIDEAFFRKWHSRSTKAKEMFKSVAMEAMMLNGKKVS